MNKLLIITGPTATGKTKLGVDLAREFNGEIISADSRQVYKHMDIATGKDLESNYKLLITNYEFIGRNPKFTHGHYNFSGVPVWGLDIVEPDYWFNVADWVEYATSVISDIWRRGKLPIIVGGTGQYIRSLLKPPETMNIPVDTKLRTELLSYSAISLQDKLKKIDEAKWQAMNESDRQNPRRLVRAIEVTSFYRHSGDPLNGGDSRISQGATLRDPGQARMTDMLVIGLNAPKKVLDQRIADRVEQRIQDGVVGEVKSLLGRGYTWDLPSMSAAGYKQFKFKLQFKKHLTKDDIDEVKTIWTSEEQQYAKRQMTYLKKYFPEACWFDISQDNIPSQIRQKVRSLVQSE